MSDQYKWYWRKTNGEADCGVFRRDESGHYYSVCRAPRYATEEQWTATATDICAALNQLTVQRYWPPAADFPAHED